MNIDNTVILIIMDGLGISPITEGNAVYKSKTPCLDNLLKNYPSTLLKASGQEVGLEFGEMGNSEVGHLNIGTGRVIMQDLQRINQSIKDNTFYQNIELKNALKNVKKNQSSLHLLGLVSTGGVHSHLDHLLALLDLAKQEGLKNVYLHLITDGRDSPPKKALDYIGKVEDKIKQLGVGKIASLIGRYFAMDRDKHWQDRTQVAYNLLALGKGETFKDTKSAVEAGYKATESDENLSAKLINEDGLLKDKDTLIFFNFRSDRSKQLSHSLIDPDFNDFKRQKVIKNLYFLSFTNYGFEPTANIKTAFFNQKITFPLAEILANNKLSQLHIAETEKYAHVTYFFNGGLENPFSNEDRILIPSPRVTSYDKTPEMSAKEITKRFISSFKAKKPAFSVINFANPDMVGHTGNLVATIKAVEFVDSCLAQIIEDVSDQSNIIITADHGNCEQMINPETKEIDKEHTTNPVPFILVSDKKSNSNKDKISLSTVPPTGVLADVSPTILDLLEIKKPAQMTGQSLKDII